MACDARIVSIQKDQYYSNTVIDLILNTLYSCLLLLDDPKAAATLGLRSVQGMQQQTA